MLSRLSSKIKCLGFILYFVCYTTFAEDLSTILNLAIEADPTIKEAEATKLASLELLPQARAQLLPTVAANAGTTYTNSNNQLLGRYNTFTYGATLSQQVLNIANWLKYQQADESVKSAVASYEDAKQDLIIRVTQQYFNILKALDDLNFAKAESKAFSQHLAETRQKFKAGVIAITDVNEAQAKYDSAVAQEISSINELSNQKEIMGEITGVPAKDISILKYNISLHPPQPNNIEYWVETSVKENFLIQSKNFDVEAARKNKEVQRAGHYPTIQADGSTAKAKSAPPSPVKANTNTIGLTLTIPLFSGGSITSKTRQAAHQYELAIQQSLEAKRKVISNVRQSYRGVLTQISQIKALQQSVISGKSALDATQAAFEVGTRTIVDVLNSQSDLLSAKSNLSKARYDYILNSFKLKRYAGNLQIEDVNIINGWLQPAPSSSNDSDATPDAEKTTK